MSDPNQMASYLMSMEGRFMSPSATGAAFEAGHQGAGDINNRKRNQAISGLKALAPGAQALGSLQSLRDRMANSRILNPNLNAKYNANSDTQAKRIGVEEASEAESNAARYFKDVGYQVGGSGSARNQLTRLDEGTIFAENVGTKIVIANGNKN